MSGVECPGCGALVPDAPGPTHAYVPSAPGCWRAFGEIQADEMARFSRPPAHRLVVDAYMAQHPCDGRDRRDRQSVFVHLVALCAALEHAMAPAFITRLLGVLARGRADFPALVRSSGPGALTVVHMRGAGDVCEYGRRAREWGGAVWEAWSDQQALVREALARAVGSPPHPPHTNVCSPRYN